MSVAWSAVGEILAAFFVFGVPGNRMAHDPATSVETFLDERDDDEAT